jgi:hypothetical protein
MGIVWSSLLWRRQVITETQTMDDQKQAVEQAVQESNTHSDARMGLRGVKWDESHQVIYAAEREAAELHCAPRQLAR